MYMIDGRLHAQKIREHIRQRVSGLKTIPGLAVVRIGEDPASIIYVRAKKKACLDVGFAFEEYILPAIIPEEEVIALIKRLNQASHIHGILLQLPAPKHLNANVLINHILPEKDVDGLTDINMGRLWNGHPLFTPCTPKGSLRLIQDLCPHLDGAHAVVLGRSRIVGRPLSALLSQHNCTTTLIHSHTRNPKFLCQQADILVAAVGHPNLVKADWVKPGAIVIDVGITRQRHEDGTETLVGDVDFDEVSKVASAITPVPGGVGPMTIACLLENVLHSALHHQM